MDKKYNDLADTPAFDAAAELVRNLLEKGVSVPDISFALAAVATDLGLQMAPSAEHAIAVVTDAIRQAATNHAFANSQTESGSDAEVVGDETISIDPGVFGRTIH